VGQQGPQDGREPEQAKRRGADGGTDGDVVADAAAGVESAHGQVPACFCSFSNITLASASTMKVITNSNRPSVTSDDTYVSPTAPVNSLASAAEIDVPGARSEALMRWALPITKVTAIVSPSARPRPSMMPPTTPTRVKGSTMFHTTSQVVAPSA